MIQPGRWLYAETGVETRVSRWIIICWNFSRSLRYNRLPSSILPTTRRAHTRLMCTSARTSSERYASIDLQALLVYSMTEASNTHMQRSIVTCNNNTEIQLSTDSVSIFGSSNRRQGHSKFSTVTVLLSRTVSDTWVDEIWGTVRQQRHWLLISPAEEDILDATWWWWWC